MLLFFFFGVILFFIGNVSFHRVITVVFLLTLVMAGGQFLNMFGDCVSFGYCHTKTYPRSRSRFSLSENHLSVFDMRVNANAPQAHTPSNITSIVCTVCTISTKYSAFSSATP